MRRVFAAFVIALLATQAIAQEQKETFASLTERGGEVVGMIPSTAGPGILIKMARDLYYMCFVAETPGSETIATQYCKKVE